MAVMLSALLIASVVIKLPNRFSFKLYYLVCNKWNGGVLPLQGVIKVKGACVPPMQLFCCIAWEYISVRTTATFLTKALH